MDDFLNKVFKAHQGCQQCPKSEEVSEFFHHLLGFMFPNFTSESFRNEEELKLKLDDLRRELSHLLQELGRDHISDKVEEFFDSLPRIYKMLHQDVDAIYAGDPAAKSREEVIRSYPGFFAIAAYRVAHQLLQMGIRQIPRSITEYAHGKTGIDIHPGAVIGKQFCIDHGTGVVIGETTVIGDHVKIYQGVTIGALSIDKKLANTKRHPTIEDNVVIYSGATILGGNTVIGENAIIGGNVWLTNSVPANSKVYYRTMTGEESKSSRGDAIIIKTA